MLLSFFPERSISAAANDRERVGNELEKQSDMAQLEEFLQAQSEVEVIITTETEELDAWMICCHSDMSSIGL